ncbi:TrmH family RNA methyltransferase [Aureibaculum sp. 2210JD6-5]|uniref:TrmH family RNA methyltransferase n=1 Tax=Aureibaculum sp. 2210JD6-5 TaxID=3103957 RepID=UPI002AAE468E|nr:TrmH family RNA methyltransferase [Aureibaculum sp. 2210JD6-5]MDY7395210.1 TrmH family RNA methyltransferase [Aureibaculum sp. 2210JD6-5]
MKQLTHNEIENKKRKFPITVVCDALRTPENVGMCFRVAESFGVQKIYLHENYVDLENRKVQKTSRNTIPQILHDRYADFSELIKQLKAEDNTIIGLEITDNSKAIQDYDFKKYQKIVLVLGSERNGISDINLLDNSVKIPMYGTNSSMNVIHSLAIALYEITNQINQ